MSADINNLAPDKPVGLGMNKGCWTSSSVASILYEMKSQSQASQEEPTVVPVISPLQAALRGFARFSYSRSKLFEISYCYAFELRKAEQPQHEEVIMFLLGSGSKLNDLGGQNVYPIQLAAKFCPGHIVEKFISAGTDVNSSRDGESALFAATERELSADLIVRRLLAVGATIPKEVEKQKKLLEQALRYFEGNTSRKYFGRIGDPDSRFLVAPSL